MDCRLIFDPPAAGAWNMAVDEVLLESALRDNIATLRFYQWQEPTLSLGYFQNYSDRTGHLSSSSLPCVRRHSGGGALVHHHELTYALALPASAVPPSGPTALYTAAHEAIIEVLRGFAGPEHSSSRLKLCSRPTKRSASEEPFLCFQRRTEGDLLVCPSPPEASRPHSGSHSATDHKVGGSAQRKSRGALLQHGGLLLGQSEYAPELPGLLETLGTSAAPATIAQCMSESLFDRLSLSPSESSLKATETAQAQQILASRFDLEDWTHRR